VRGEKSELLQLYEREVALGRNIKIPKSLRRLHPVPEQWVKDTRCSPSLIKEVPLESRTYKVYSGLLSFAETAGFAVAQPKPVPSSCVLSYQDVRVEICVKERTRHIRRLRTAEEIAAAPWLGTKWRNIQEPTDELVLTVGSEADNPKRPSNFPTSWGDTPEGGLETKLPEVFAGLIATVAAVQQRRAIERERELEERRRGEVAEERRRQRERAEERKAKLRRDAMAWREAADLREFVAAVQSAGKDHAATLPMPLEEWVQWSLAVADEIDPLR
jgi:hypothetical protein